ncbi:MAG: hypothetical protein IPL53_16060 [Ignavibacteria bacterium]|nr:hypothetical protein [Ignavibacteria bacterium]
METIVNQIQTTGTYSVIFDGTNLTSGAYYYTISVASAQEIILLITRSVYFAEVMKIRFFIIV